MGCQVKCSEERYSEILNDLCDGDDSYSFLKEYLLISHPDLRVLIQMKCIEKFKWEFSQDLDEPLTWEDAVLLWNDKGHAAAFADAFDPDLCICEIYEKTLNIQSRT